jgi:aspartate aminotransferase
VIAAELEQLLEPLERFEQIRRGVARLGDRLADLSYANPYEGVQESARDALRETLAEERALDLQYAPFGGQTLSRRAVADALRESHGLPFAFSDVVLTPGAMAALHIALRTAGRPGDEVLVPVPCWLDYPLFVRHCGLVPVLVPLEPPRFGLDAARLVDAVSERTCAVLLSHPANPTGRSYGRAELADVCDALRGAEDRLGCRITLIADETHRDFIAPGRYESASAAFDRTVIVYSFGKYHFMQGQRLGYAATSPRHPDREQAASELVRWTRIAGFATPTALMQRAVPRLLRLHHDHGWVDGWRQRVLEELTSAGFDVVRPDGTLFVYVRTPAAFDDFALVSELASAGVLVLPAPVFHHRGYFRLSLTGSGPMLERALAGLTRLAVR